MKDFDQVHGEDREFKIGGQTFHWRQVGWREQAQWLNDNLQRVERELAADEKARADAEKKGKTYDPPERDLVRDMEGTEDVILHFVVIDERERVKEALRSEANPVTILQLNELARWLQEVQQERPLTSELASSTGAGTTAPTSPAG